VAPDRGRGGGALPFRPVAAENGSFDPIDRRILEILATEARISWKDLGQRVHLSPNTVADRVRRLERLGVVVGFEAVLDPERLGLPIEAMIEVRRRPEVPPDDVEEAFRQLPAVIDAVHLTGRWDYLLRVRCPSTLALDQLVRALKTDHGVVETETRVVLRRVAGIGRQPASAT
jgi:Lrp/AsnC family transcriptional regulator, leucine-responsive regulatory protein